MAQHTPGPWIWAGVTETRDLDATSGERGYYCIGDSSGAPIASLSNQPIGNARLIAAAPELLAALIQLREWVRNPGEDDSAENEAVIYQAEAAIAEATGE